MNQSKRFTITYYEKGPQPRHVEGGINIVDKLEGITTEDVKNFIFSEKFKNTTSVWIDVYYNRMSIPQGAMTITMNDSNNWAVTFKYQPAKKIIAFSPNDVFEMFKNYFFRSISRGGRRKRSTKRRPKRRATRRRR